MIPLEIMSTMSRMWQVYGANARLTANRSRVFRADEYVVPPAGPKLHVSKRG